MTDNVCLWQNYVTFFYHLLMLASSGKFDKREVDEYIERYSRIYILENYEKEKVLSKLCDIIAFSKRVLQEDEKDFLFRYIHDAIIDGFLPENIGLRDEVFAGLMSDRDDMDTMSELELSHLRERNGEIVEFAKEFDFKLGFFEKSAVKLIRYNPAYIPEMVQRCK